MQNFLASLAWTCSVFSSCEVAFGQDAPGSELGPIEQFESDSFSLDRSANSMTFDGFRITAQGWNLRANQAIANADELGFEAGEWRFAGDILVNIETATLTADAAVFQFRNKLLVSASLTGAPVVFEDTVSIEDGPVFGDANELRYDTASDTVELLGDVNLTVGPYRITGCDLIYFLGEEEFTTGSAQCAEPFRTIFDPVSDDSEFDDDPLPQ